MRGMKFCHSDIPPLRGCKHNSIKGLHLIMFQKQNTTAVLRQTLHCRAFAGIKYNNSHANKIIPLPLQLLHCTMKPVVRVYQQ